MAPTMHCKMQLRLMHLIEMKRLPVRLNQSYKENQLISTFQYYVLAIGKLLFSFPDGFPARVAVWEL